MSVKSAVDRLSDASKVIQHRMGLKQVEEKHVKDAFMLLATGPPAADSKGAKQRAIYLDFLRSVQAVLGLSGSSCARLGWDQQPLPI